MDMEIFRSAKDEGIWCFNICKKGIQGGVVWTRGSAMYEAHHQALMAIYGKQGLVNQIRKLASAQEAVAWFNAKMETSHRYRNTKGKLVHAFLKGSARGLERKWPEFLKLWMDSNNGNVFFVSKEQKLEVAFNRHDLHIPKDQSLIKALTNHL